jgi:hypothetical protein
MMLRSMPLTLAAATLVVLMAACGDDATPGTGSNADAVEPADPWPEFPSVEAREDARGYLGMYESDLPDTVRIGRRGDEHFPLTRDYRLGRVTVELDDLDGSGYRVTSLVVELPDGPETFHLEPG